MIGHMTAQEVGMGGEGLIVRDPDKHYCTERVHHVLKIKPRDDNEGVVVGWVAGKKGFTGMVGAVLVEYGGKRFEVGGLNRGEQVLAQEQAGWAP